MPLDLLSPPRVLTSKEWGARSVETRFAHFPAAGIVTHHTAGPNMPPLEGAAERLRCQQLARAIQRDHQTRKPVPYKDSGHHFLICRSGLILEGRKDSFAQAMRGRCVQGAHCGNAEVNKTHFGAEWEGRNDVAFSVTKEQWESGVHLYAWLAYWGRFDTANTFPHRQFKATACPGKLADHLDRLRQEAHDLKLRIIAALK